MVNINYIFYFHKHASLACAPRLADTLCPQSLSAGAWSLSIAYFGSLVTLYKYCKQNLINNFSYSFENMIFEIYTPENPMSTVESQSLASFCICLLYVSNVNKSKQN